MRLLNYARLAALIPVLLIAGCAKVPASTSTGTSRLVEFTMTIRGNINPNYYYFVVINRTNNPNDAGPVPVVNSPWGNGFAAAAQQNAQGFVTAVVFNSTLGGTSGYGVYNVPTDNSTCTDTTSACNVPTAKPYQIGNGVSGFVPIGQPDRYTTPQTGEHTLTFRLDLSRLPNPNAPYMQVNFIATNNLPIETGNQANDDSQSKLWDAIGDGRGTGDVGSINAPVTFDVRQNQYQSSSSSTNPEPQNDVRDHLASVVDEPQLDITDWSVQVLSSSQ